MGIKSEHYILTRFNLRLWSKDKKQNETRTDEWLKQRFELFEQFCLPSVISQTNQSFQWIVLFDAQTPEYYKEKIKEYETQCKQFCPCFVQPNEGRYFVKIFREEIRKRIHQDTQQLITTYLDNDDALHRDFVKDIQQVKDKGCPTFVSFVYGLQYYTELNIATRVPFFNNHFVSLIERLSDDEGFRTVYGYGSHISVHKAPHTKTVYIDNPNQDRWIEVVHETNMDNDVKMTFDTRLVKNRNLLTEDYGLDIVLNENSRNLYYTTFLCRVIREVFRHIKLKIVGRKWN